MNCVVDTVYVGAFRAVDEKLQSRVGDSTPGSAKGSERYIDFAYSSSQTGFAGVHRFSVARGSNDGQVGLG